MIKKANLDCQTCGYMLLIDDEKDIVFCQKCEKQIKPNYKMYNPIRWYQNIKRDVIFLIATTILHQRIQWGNTVKNIQEDGNLGR